MPARHGPGTLASFLAPLLAASLAACGGGGSSGTSSTPTGVWDGLYGLGGDTPSIAYQLALLPDGTVRTREGAALDTLGTGTWSRSGNTVELSYTTGGSTTYDVSAKLDGLKLTGTWGTDPSATDGGKVAFTKAAAGAEGIWLGSSSGTTSGEVLMIAWPGSGFEFWDRADLTGKYGYGAWMLTGALLDGSFVYQGTYCDYEATLDGDHLAGTLTGGAVFGGNITDVDRVK
jgi:hypothetical protein